MRRIRFQPPTNEKKWQRWLQDCQKANGEVQKSIDRGEKPEFNQNLYKRRKAELFGDESSFHGKCAYCECYISGFQHGDVEHFRPKAGVTDESDRAIERSSIPATIGWLTIGKISYLLAPFVINPAQ